MGTNCQDDVTLNFRYTTFTKHSTCECTVFANITFLWSVNNKINAKSSDHDKQCVQSFKLMWSQLNGKLTSQNLTWYKMNEPMYGQTNLDAERRKI